MCKADDKIQITECLSLQPEMLQCNLQIPAVQYSMSESFWFRTITVFGEAQLAEIC